MSTTARGFRKATSVYGTLTGLGGDIFIIDDPLKPVDAQSEAQRNGLNQWVSNTLMSRLDSKERGVVIVVMQRVHLNDLSGYLIESGDWTVLSLPAIAEQDEVIAIGEDQFHRRRAGEALHPEFESLASLQKLQRQIGSDVFAAQYQQCPVPPGGAIIRREWARYYDHLPERTYRTEVDSELGHGREGRHPERLVRLYDVDDYRRPLLSHRPNAWSLRISTPS